MHNQCVDQNIMLVILMLLCIKTSTLFVSLILLNGYDITLQSGGKTLHGV